MRCTEHLGGCLGESVLRGGRAGGRADRATAGEDLSFRAALFADAGLVRSGDGGLLVAGVPVESIARSAGTPAFVYNAEAIRAKFGALELVLGALPHRVHYAVKANGNLAVLRVLQQLGAGCDIVSAGELARALAAGFDPEMIVFSGVGKTRDELALACRTGIGQINIESLEELAALESLAAPLERPVRTGIRINPSVTVDTHPFISTGTAAAKFGIPADLAVTTALRIAAHPGLRLTGLAMHLGSQLLDVAPYVEGARQLAGLVTEIRQAGVATLEGLDLGGGLGIRYHHERPLEPLRLAEA
ncbi:MAG TPA: alanine racemase, partial [Gemmatimonadales bacterium]